MGLREIEHYPKDLGLENSKTGLAINQDSEDPRRSWF